MLNARRTNLHVVPRLRSVLARPVIDEVRAVPRINADGVAGRVYLQKKDFWGRSFESCIVGAQTRVLEEARKKLCFGMLGSPGGPLPILVVVMGIHESEDAR